MIAELFLVKILQKLICDTNSFSYFMLVMGIFVYYLSKQGQFLLLRPGWQMSSWPPPCPLQSVSVQVLMLIRERSCGLPALALTPASSEPWSEVGPIHSLTDHKYFGLSTPRKVEKVQTLKKKFWHLTLIFQFLLHISYYEIKSFMSKRVFDCLISTSKNFVFHH